MHAVELFAPKRVAMLVHSVYMSMTNVYVSIDKSASVSEGASQDELDPLPLPTFPDELWRALRDAIRRDLGVRKLRVPYGL